MSNSELATESSSKPERVRPQRTLKLHWVGVAFIVGAVILHMQMPDRPGSWGVYALMERVWELVVGFVVAFVLGLVGYYAARRSSLVFNVVLCLLLSLRIAADGVVLWAANQAAARSRAQEAIAAASKSQEEAKERGDGAAAARATETLAAELRSAASSLSARDRAVAEAGVVIMERMSVRKQAYDKAQSHWIASGALTSTAALTAAGVDERLAALEAVQASAKEMVKLAEALRAGMADELKRRGVPDAEAEDHGAAFARGAKAPALVTYWNSYVAYFDAARDYLQHLKATAGAWVSEDSVIKFVHEEDLAKFQEIVRRCRETAQETDRQRAMVVGK